MFELEITNGDLEIIKTGSLLVQAPTKPLKFDLSLSNKSRVTVTIKFEDAKDASDAGVDTIEDLGEDAIGLILRIPKNTSHRSVIDTPLLKVGEEKIFLAIGWNKTNFGEISFEYTFSVTKGLIKKLKASKGKKNV